MGADGCARVRWDAGATGRYKNKANRHKNGCKGHDLGPMAGEISPNIMFCKKVKKMHGWLWMGAHGFTKVVYGACMWREAKTRGKDAQMVEKSHISDA